MSIHFSNPHVSLRKVKRHVCLTIGDADASPYIDEADLGEMLDHGEYAFHRISVFINIVLRDIRSNMLMKTHDVELVFFDYL